MIFEEIFIFIKTHYEQKINFWFHNTSISGPIFQLILKMNYWLPICNNLRTAKNTKNFTNFL